MSKQKTIGIFGGTFDPIHLGHLRAGTEVIELFELDEIRLIPCKHPPHRTTPMAEPHHRLQMLSLATENSKLMVDDREMKREGPSYFIDTLMSVRREFPTASLCMVVGIDAFLGLPYWYQWEKLIQLANIVVIYRSGWTFPETGITVELLKKHQPAKGEKLNQFTHGKITTQFITTLDIQASRIRALIEAKQTPQFLIPEKVLDYIQVHQLYGYNKDDFLTPQQKVTRL
jgi:nicotinate-nucleotide adenylyltransferase